MFRKRILLLSEDNDWDFHTKHSEVVDTDMTLKYDFRQDNDNVNLYSTNYKKVTENIIPNCIRIKQFIDEMPKPLGVIEERRLIVAIHHSSSKVPEGSKEAVSKLNRKKESKDHKLFFTHYTTEDRSNPFVRARVLNYWIEGKRKICRDKLKQFIKLMEIRLGEDEEEFFETKKRPSRYLDICLLSLVIDMNGLNSILKNIDGKSDIAKNIALTKAQRYLDEVFEDDYLKNFEFVDDKIKQTINKEEEVKQLIACLTGNKPPEIEEFANKYLHPQKNLWVALEANVTKSIV